MDEARADPYDARYRRIGILAALEVKQLCVALGHELATARVARRHQAALQLLLDRIALLSDVTSVCLDGEDADPQELDAMQAILDAGTGELAILQAGHRKAMAALRASRS